MSFKLIEVQSPSPPGLLIINARSRTSITTILFTLFLSFVGFMFLKSFLNFNSYSAEESLRFERQLKEEKRVTFFEEFEGKKGNKWWKEESNFVSAGVKDGKYIIHLKENSGIGHYFAHQGVKIQTGSGEFESILSLETNKISGDDGYAYGILFGGKTNLKRFFIDGTGKYALQEERFNDTKLINKTGKPTFSTHIQKGNSKNTLKVEFHGQNAILLVNGHQLETIPHQFGLGRGNLARVGFFINSDKKQKTEIHFDNLFYGNPDSDDIVSAKEPVSTKELDLQEYPGSEFIIGRIYQELAYSRDFPSWMIPYSWPPYLIFGFIIFVLAQAFKNLLIPSEHKFDQRSNIYSRDGRSISPFSEIKGVDIRKIGGNTGGDGGGPAMYLYTLFLLLKDANRIKLFAFGTEQEALSSRAMIRKMLRYEDEVLTSEERLEAARTSNWVGFILLFGIISFVITVISIEWQDTFSESWRMTWFIISGVSILFAIIFGNAFGKSIFLDSVEMDAQTEGEDNNELAEHKEVSTEKRELPPWYKMIRNLVMTGMLLLFFAQFFDYIKIPSEMFNTLFIGGIIFLAILGIFVKFLRKG